MFGCKEEVRGRLRELLKEELYTRFQATAMVQMKSALLWGFMQHRIIFC